MHYFSSTAIHAANYVPDTRTLTIWFTSSGRQYDYFGVPEAVFRGLLNAASPGSYFNDHIRDQYAS